MPGPYALLGVDRTVDPETLKRRWRELARALHPDRNPDPDAAQRLVVLNEAYGVLSDPERRRLYDTYGEDALSAFFVEGAAAPPRTQPATAPRGPRAVEAGEDLLAELTMSAEQAYSGGVHELEPEPRRTCERCGGSGWRTAGRACGKCEGGQLPGSGTWRLMVPPRLVSGQVLIVRGSGRAGRGHGARPGDLRVTVRVPPSFHDQDGVIHTTVPCPDVLRREGGSLVVDLPGGSQVKVKVPAGAKRGLPLRLRGKGGDGRDLVVRLGEGPGAPREIQAAKLR